MGARKKISAEKRKEALKTMYFAKLQNVPTSPRKMRLVADLIRGMEVNRALGVLKFSSKEAAARVEKLLRSAIANWEQKNERKAESGELFVTKIFVDGGATLKRMRPAPQGRGYRIRKRRYLRRKSWSYGIRRYLAAKSDTRMLQVLRMGLKKEFSVILQQLSVRV